MPLAPSTLALNSSFLLMCTQLCAKIYWGFRGRGSLLLPGRQSPPGWRRSSFGRMKEECDDR